MMSLAPKISWSASAFNTNICQLAVDMVPTSFQCLDDRLISLSRKWLVVAVRHN
jgi:hypothetical protein